MNNSPESTIELLTRVKQAQIKFIDLQFTDIVGVVKNVTIPVHELSEALENENSGSMAHRLKALPASQKAICAYAQTPQLLPSFHG